MRSIDEDAADQALSALGGAEDQDEDFDPEEDEMLKEDLGELSPEEMDLIRMVRAMKTDV